MSKLKEAEQYLRENFVVCNTEEEEREFLGFVEDLGVEMIADKEKYISAFPFWYRISQDGVLFTAFQVEYPYVKRVEFQDFKEKFMTREFKAGDKVRLRDELTVKEMNEDPGMTPGMWAVARGRRVMTINLITSIADRVMVKEHEDFYWHPDWFELVEPAEEYKEYTVEELERKLGHKIKIRGEE